MRKNKLGYYFAQEFLKNYLSILFAFGLIIWITQAVRLLDLIGEEGNSITTYFLYILSILPKFFSRISIIIFFISFVVTISKFEEHNELRALWFSGLEKKKIYKLFIKIYFYICFNTNNYKMFYSSAFFELLEVSAAKHRDWCHWTFIKAE
jgi:lipopolysaccharide export system permease protein